MIDNFEYRDVILLPFDDLKTRVLRLESTVITYFPSESSNRIHSLDVGCFCYSSRSNVAGRGLTGAAVDKSSFDPVRVPLVQATIDFVRGASAVSAGRKYTEIKQFYTWIDSQEVSISFNCLESMKSAYIEYTRNLLQLINVSKAGRSGIAKKTAQNYQKTAAVVVAAATELSVHQVMGLATRITKGRNVDAGFNEIDSQDERSRSFAALVKFIDEVHRVTVLKGQLPILFSSPNDDDFFYFVPSQVRGKGRDQGSVYSKLRIYNKFPTNNEFEEHSGFIDQPDGKQSQKFILTNIRMRLKDLAKNPRSDFFLSLANRAMSAGLVTFFAATGTNLTVALELLMHSEQVVPTTKGNRYSGTKGRSEGKDVFPEFGAEYSPVFKKIKAIRTWLLDGRVSQLVFPYQDGSGLITRMEPSCVGEVRKLFKEVLPNTAWITPRKWRKGVGSEYIKLSGGDTILTSEKLGNTEGVVRASYARPSFEDTAVELSSFFDKAFDAAINRTRVQPVIPVTVLVNEASPSNIPTGRCDKPSESNPELAKGFTSLAPTPSCGEPVTCLFCSFYGIHADEQDVRRLLSLQFLLKSSKGSMPNERFIQKFSPMLHRVDEILVEVEAHGKFQENFISDIKADVARGKLDEFWKIHFNTFVSVGVVS
ncbi:hypothetical protein ACJ6YJ_18235 [Pseudomonas marginalis]|uniref:hypothetical protein n=1 Tax=Pseudomonas TaxID=286 RepID=UPI00389AF028